MALTSMFKGANSSSKVILLKGTSVLKSATLKTRNGKSGLLDLKAFEGLEGSLTLDFKTATRVKLLH